MPTAADIGLTSSPIGAFAWVGSRILGGGKNLGRDVTGTPIGDAIMLGAFDFLIPTASAADSGDRRVVRDPRTGRITGVVTTPMGQPSVFNPLPGGPLPATNLPPNIETRSGGIFRGGLRRAGQIAKKLPKLPGWARFLGYTSVYSLLVDLAFRGVDWIADPVNREKAARFLEKYGELIAAGAAVGQAQVGLPGAPPFVPSGGPRRTATGPAKKPSAPARAVVRRAPLPVPGPLIPEGPIANVVISPRPIPGVPTKLPKFPTRGQQAKAAAKKALDKLLSSPTARSVLLGLIPKSGQRIRLDLTGLNALGVSSPQPQPAAGGGFYGLRPSQTLEDQCRELRKKKRKPRKARDVCYRGTYTETATGLIKRKKEKVPCQPSRKKRP